MNLRSYAVFKRSFILGSLTWCTSIVHAGALHFEEVAVESGINATYLTPGYTFDDYNGGAVVGDFNNDGWQDLFIFSGGLGDVPDHLYINNGDGSFTDEAVAWGIADIPHRGRGASVADFNDDGWLDLFLTSAGPMSSGTVGRRFLYRNNGDGTFTDIADASGVDDFPTTTHSIFGSTWGDYDLDGDLDLFVAGFSSHDTNRLFRNNGDSTFTDITDDINFFAGTPSSISGFSPRFLDMDGDWYPEVLLIADFGTSRYFRNNADGTFTDVTVSAGTSQETDGMGQTVGDFNNDGLFDWYATSIQSSGCQGNKLYYNLGNHVYDEVACDVGVHQGGYGWGAIAVDFNHDGLLDLAETNGGPFFPFVNVPTKLWLQNESGTFDEMSALSGLVHLGEGRGMINFDYDNDGDQDVAISGYQEQFTLFRNDISGPDTNWLKVWLDTSNTDEIPPSGFGAIVSATIDGFTMYRSMTSGSNFESNSEFSAHLGLAGAESVDELTVEWPNGDVTTMTNVAANQSITIVYGEMPNLPGDLDDDGDVDFADLLALLAAWGECESECPEDLDHSGSVGFADLLILLNNWS